MSVEHHEGEERICLMCGDPIPDEVLFIDEGAECCSTDCMDEYASTLIYNYFNWDGAEEVAD